MKTTLVEEKKEDIEGNSFWEQMKGL